MASKTVDVRLNKVLDPEIAAFLDDRNSSSFGSDVEDLEDDFVVQANIFEGSGGQEVDEKFIDEEHDEKLSFAADSRFDHLRGQGSIVSGSTEDRSSSCLGNEKLRVRRPLDEQFDLVSH